MSLIVLELLSMYAIERFNQINNPIKSLSAYNNEYDRDVSLSQIRYNVNITQKVHNFIKNDMNAMFDDENNRGFIDTLYTQNNYKLFWFDWHGIERDKVFNFLDKVQSDPTLDEKSKLYTDLMLLRKEAGAFSIADSMNKQMDFDVRLNAFFKDYMNYVFYGSIDWQNFEDKLVALRASEVAAYWVTYTPKYDIAKLILNHKAEKIIESATPISFGYREMIAHIAKLKKVKASGGYVKITASSSDATLKDRLMASDDYKCEDMSILSNYCLKSSIGRFQKRYGLIESGKLNESTIEKLNTPIDTQIEKLILNANRIKRIVDVNSSSYFFVNIPDFTLKFIENKKVTMGMNVVVGDNSHRTPVFSSDMSTIVLNPDWSVPVNIANKEFLPKLASNPNYLKNIKYELKYKGRTVNSSSVNWKALKASGKMNGYKIVQPPSDKNALGKIKFLFPNHFAVYMHDTPAKSKFLERRRNFSHGCVRLAQPEELLKKVVAVDGGISEARAFKILASDQKSHIALKHKIPVHIVYLTAWVDTNGYVNYRDDIYGYDTLQQKKTK